MIHEWRSYRLKPGAAAEYLTLLCDQGLPLVTRHLPLMGYWLAESGPLNVIHHLWSYADWAEREAARAALATEEAWTRGFIPRAFALVEEQQNCLMQIVLSSPAFEASLARRQRSHPLRRPGAPLFADSCAGLVRGLPPADPVATWRPLSGDRRPFALLPRRADPLPEAPLDGADHVILRPLAFSPL